MHSEGKRCLLTALQVCAGLLPESWNQLGPVWGTAILSDKRLTAVVSGESTDTSLSGHGWLQEFKSWVKTKKFPAQVVMVKCLHQSTKIDITNVF